MSLDRHWQVSTKQHCRRHQNWKFGRKAKVKSPFPTTTHNLPSRQRQCRPAIQPVRGEIQTSSNSSKEASYTSGSDDSKLMSGRQRQQQHGRRMQRRSSDDSYSSATSPSKTHRRSFSFNGLSSLGSLESPGSGSDTSMKASPTKENHLRSASWSSGISASSCADMTDCSPESKTIRRKTLGDGEDNTFCAFELIRQLSFSPTQKTKKRANTAETEASSSFDSSDTNRKHPIGLDLDLDLEQMYDLRRSPSPLLGLQYLPEENMFI